MKIKILALGEKMPKWVQEGYQEYQKRLSSSSIKLEMVELPIAKRGKNNNTQKLMAQEAKSILNKLSDNDYIVVLDPQGKMTSTEDLAVKIESWQQTQPNVALIIGGPDGIDTEIKKMAQEKISFSRMTFPHPIVRIVLVEQIYRAWTILQGHPYHK
jgi:23S rRNA (pseudouridine1915-N3)-methyltransferase